MLEARKELLKALRAAPVVLRALVRELDDQQIRRRPAPDEWAIVEVVSHLAYTDERALARVRRMLDEEDPELPSYDQDELARAGRYIERDLATELSRFERIRTEHVAQLDALDEPAWKRAGIHEEHGRMTVELYEAHVAGEDADHLAQIARLIDA